MFVLKGHGYCTKDAARVMKMNGYHNGAIKKNNMKGKNHRLDNFLSGLRITYESTFSKMDIQVLYCGLAKVQFRALMESVAYNLKHLIAIDAPLIFG